MLVKLKLHAIVADQIGDVQNADVAEGTTLQELLSTLHIDDQRAGFVLLNGRRVPYDTELHDGDVVFVMPFLGGG